MRRLRYRLRNFMAGRNGFDALSVTLLAVAAALALLTLLAGPVVFALLGSTLAVWALARVFSRALGRRQEEYWRFTAPFRKLKTAWDALRDKRRLARQYKFFRCPGCGERLRVPRGKGKLHITCPRCGHRFGGST